MSCLSRFRLITFDVTDTLIKFRTAPGKQYGEIGALFGINQDEHHDLVANFKANWRKMNRAHPNFGLKTKISEREWWRRLIRGTFDAHQLSDEKVNSMTNYLLDLYKTSTCWQLTYGTVDFLNYLKLQKQFGSQSGEPKLKLGVISNFDSRLDVLLRNMKLNHYFDFVLGSYQAGVEKPDKEIFKIAMKASELKDLKPDQCLHIGNTPVTDYFGPRSAGWYSLLIHEKTPEKLREKYGENIQDHHVYQNFIDLHKDISKDYIKF